MSQQGALCCTWVLTNFVNVALTSGMGGFQYEGFPHEGSQIGGVRHCG